MSEVEPMIANLLYEMDSTAMIFAYLYRIHGLEGFMALLDASGPLTQASLMKAADELMQLDMPELAEAIAEAAANAPEPVCPHEPNTGDFRAWHQVRGKKPFDTQKEAEQCLLNMGYGLDDDDLWTNRFGQVESKVLPTGQGFRILSLKAGADWQEYL